MVIADCPGSANRGKVWAERLYKQMGVVEVDMQIKGTLLSLSHFHVFHDLFPIKSVIVNLNPVQKGYLHYIYNQ